MPTTKVSPLDVPGSDGFWATITGVGNAGSDGVVPYSWQEQRGRADDLLLEDNEFGRNDVDYDCPAVSPCGKSYCIGDEVFLKLRGWFGQLTCVYDIINDPTCANAYPTSYNTTTCCEQCQTVDVTLICASDNGDGTLTNQFNVKCWPSGQTIANGCIKVSACPCNQYYSSPGMVGACVCQPSCNVPSYALAFTGGQPANGACFGCAKTGGVPGFPTTFAAATNISTGWCLTLNPTIAPAGCVYTGAYLNGLCGPVTSFDAALTINPDGSATLSIATIGFTNTSQAQYNAAVWKCGQFNQMFLNWSNPSGTSACKKWPTSVTVYPCLNCGAISPPTMLNCPPGGGGSGGSSSPVIITFGSTTTWTAPAGITSITVQAWGGGQKGVNRGGVGNGTLGGAGGDYATGTISVTPGNTYNVVVGTLGGDSYFDAGADVLAAGGGSISTSIGNISVHAGGGAGAAGGASGGGGGSSAGPGSAGTAGSIPTGGVAPSGGGNGGDGGAPTDNPGNAGSVPGGGGGGASSGTAATLGGAGGAGQLTIIY